MDCPGIPERRAHGVCEVNSEREGEAILVHIVVDEILPSTLDHSLIRYTYSSLTCNFKDLNLSYREGVRCWLAWLGLAAWVAPACMEPFGEVRRLPIPKTQPDPLVNRL
jgi:hypothetical protein